MIVRWNVNSRSPAKPFFATHISILFLGILAALSGSVARGVAADSYGGILWEDTNRNGVRESEEPGLAGVPVYISEYFEYEHHFAEPFATNVSDASGRYIFTGVTNTPRSIFFFPDTKYRVTLQNAGDNENADNDFRQAHSFCGIPYPWMSLDVPVTSRTNIDAGVFGLVPSLSFSLTVNGSPSNNRLNVTNNALVVLQYSITNTGETALSCVMLIDCFDQENINIMDCPRYLGVNESIRLSRTVRITESTTNEVQVAAFAVEPCSCIMHGSAPPFQSATNVIAVVTNNPAVFDDGDVYPNDWEIACHLDPLNYNSPALNRDGDWMTDYEEFIADTDPANAQSFFPPAVVAPEANETAELLVALSSTARIYTVWVATNLMDDATGWHPLPMEQAGTGGPITFAVTNQAAGMFYRAGVVAP